MQQNGETLYARYCRMGRRMEIIGGAALAAGVLLHGLTGGHALLTLLMCAGGALLLFGALNMKPSSVIRAFAAQLSAERSAVFAQGLAEAMEKNGKTALSRRSLSALEAAIAAYAASEDADAALAQRLREAREKHVRKTMF